MSRWSYILPRLIILGLISLALWFSSDSLTRMAILNSIQNHTGGDVSIAQIRCSLGDQKLYLQEVVIADPNTENRNLAQADMAYLEFDAASLWNRNFVVNHGQTSRLMFGTPRAQIGAQPPIATQPVPVSSIQVTAKAPEEIGQAWLDNLEIPNASGFPDTNLQLNRTRQTIQAYWKNELRDINESVVAIKSHTTNLEQLASREKNNDNPLRSQWQTNSYTKIDSMASQTQATTERLELLNRQYNAHIDQLNAAEKVDAAALSQTTEPLTLDGKKISELLMANIHKDVVTQSMNMFHWFQNARPEIGVDFASKNQRGVEVDLKGVQRNPNFLVKEIEINGQGRLLDQHINFSGHAYNLSTQPQLLDAPARFEMRAQGKHHAVVSCTLDRSGKAQQDVFQINCPGLNLGERTLGHSNSLAVTLGPSNTVSAQVDLRCNDTGVHGTITLRFSKVALHVDKIDEIAGGKVAALQMNQAVTEIRNFESRIELSGDGNNIQFQSESDLGKQFAVAVNRSLKIRNENLIQQRLDSLASQKQQIVDSFRQQVGGELARLNATLSNNRNHLAELKLHTPQPSDGLRVKRF